MEKSAKQKNTFWKNKCHPTKAVTVKTYGDLTG
jgi:hypothetical protein